MARKTDPTPSLREIRKGLEQTSSVMLKMYLRYRGLVAGMKDAKDSVVNRIERYVADGDIDALELATDILRFQEYNNKRVYLYNVTGPALRNFDPGTLPELVDNVAGISLAGAFPAPTIVYSWHDTDFARVVFAETHRRAVADYARGVIHTVPVTKIVVLNVELATGFITLSYDAPEQVNPHRSHVGYYEHYRRAAETLIGTEMLQFLIGGALAQLERSPLVHIPHGRQVTADGRVDLTADGEDYREMGTYAKFAGDVIAHDRGRYVWLADDTGKKGSPELLRDVPTEMFARTSLVRFTKDCLENEVEYVIGQIRAHA